MFCLLFCYFISAVAQDALEYHLYPSECLYEHMWYAGKNVYDR